jgi:heat shock protein HslJ
MKSLETAIVAAIALLAACQSSPTSSSNLSTASEAPLTGVWALQSFDLSGGQSVTVSDPASYTLELASDGTAHVRADCNVCDGGYELADATLRLGALACTRASCPPESLDFEYLQALSSTSSIERNGTELRIGYDGGVLRFGPQ